jgi:serine/threonine protein kinase
LSVLAVELTLHRYGKQLYAVCQAYRQADHEIRESILAIEGVWLKTETQVGTLRDIWNSLDERVQIHQNHVLVVLQERLQIAITILDGLETSTSDEPNLKALLSMKGDMKRLKYAVYAKGKLEKVAKDLDEWHRRFDPSWYLLARATAPVIDQSITTVQSNPSKELTIIQELRHAHRINDGLEQSRGTIFFPKDYSIQMREQIPNTSAQTGYAAQQFVIIDSLHSTKDNDIQVAIKDARDIARILANVDPSIFSLLTCQGVIKVFNSSNQVTGFEFIFTVPTMFQELRSLRTFLLAANHDYPLDDRFRLARLLARSVSFLHSSQIVHKNIVPETVILLTDPSTGLETPFLVGFEKFRQAGSRTYMSGDTFWEKNLYRHPKRQGELPEEEYKMQHDIYSLGVCLLEIGLGTSFVHYEATSVWYVTAFCFIWLISNLLLKWTNMLK